MRVFISHSTDDQGYVDELRRKIESLGLEVESPGSPASSGDAWAEATRRHLEKSDAVVLVVPEAGTRGANNAFFEAGAAHALGKRIVAVVPERRSSRLHELPSDLLDLVVMDADLQSVGRVARTLVHALDPSFDKGMDIAAQATSTYRTALEELAK